MKTNRHPIIPSLRKKFMRLAVLMAALSIWFPRTVLSDEAGARSTDESSREKSELSALEADELSPETPGFDDSLATLDEALMFLNPIRRKRLVEIGKLQQFHPTHMETRLLPSTPLSSTFEDQIREIGLNIGIEVLYFMPNSSLPSTYHSISIDERRLTLYNILRSISTLQGLTYYSASRGENRLLFEESWTIASQSESEIALPDPIVDGIAPLDAILIHQKDKTFGSNQSRVTYSSVGHDISIAIENLTPMRYKGLIRVINPGKMQSRIIVVPVQEGLLVYGAMAAKTMNVKAFLKRAEASFTNRIIALTEWYLDHIAEEFQ